MRVVEHCHTSTYTVFQTRSSYGVCVAVAFFPCFETAV